MLISQTGPVNMKWLYQLESLLSPNLFWNFYKQWKLQDCQSWIQTTLGLNIIKGKWAKFFMVRARNGRLPWNDSDCKVSVSETQKTSGTTRSLILPAPPVPGVITVISWGRGLTGGLNWLMLLLWFPRPETRTLDQAWVSPHCSDGATASERWI